MYAGLSGEVSTWCACCRPTKSCTRPRTRSLLSRTRRCVVRRSRLLTRALRVPLRRKGRGAVCLPAARKRRAAWPRLGQARVRGFLHMLHGCGATHPWACVRADRRSSTKDGRHVARVWRNAQGDAGQDERKDRGDEQRVGAGRRRQRGEEARRAAHGPRHMRTSRARRATHLVRPCCMERAPSSPPVATAGHCPCPAFLRPTARRLTRGHSQT